MGLRLLDYHGGYFITMAAVLQNPLPARTFYDYASVHPGWDPICAAISNLAAPVGTIPVETVLNVFPDKGKPDDVRWSSKPETSRYSSIKDWNEYGNTFTTLAHLVQGAIGQDPYIFDPSHENNTRHPNYRGTVGPGLTGEPIYEKLDAITFAPSGAIDPSFVAPTWYSHGDNLHLVPYSDETLLGPSDPVWDDRRRLRSVVISQGVDGFHFQLPNEGMATNYPNYWSGWVKGDLPATLELWKSQPNAQYLWDGTSYGSGTPSWGTYPHVQALGVMISGDGSLPFSIEYTLIQHLGYSLTVPVNPAANNYWNIWQVKLTYWVDWGSPDLIHLNSGHVGAKFLPNVWDSPFPTGGMTLRCQRVATKIGEGFTVNGNQVGGWSGRAPVGTVYTHNGSWTGVFTPTHELHLSAGRAGSLIPGFSSFISKGKHRHFASEIEKSLPDIRPSSFFSTSEAVTDLTGGFDQNLIEVLTQISSFFDVFPDIGATARFIRYLTSGRYVDSLLEFMNIATEYRLKHKFGIDPNLDLILNQLPKLPAIYNRLASLSESNQVTAYGTFKHHFDYEFGRKDVSLLTKTKVVADLGADQALANVLGIKGSGFAPVPSNAWDLIPFSFVVDWFYDIGSRLRDFENASLLSLLSIKVFVHSYTITSPIEESELSEFGLSYTRPGSDDNVPELRYYRREVSAYLPLFRRSRYDFRLPTRLPSWATAGALWWQSAIKRL